MFTDLSTTPVSETIREICADRKTGDLTICAGRAVRAVFFDHGRVVFAGSNLRTDRLAESLVAQGRLREEDLNRALAFLDGERKRHLGEALVEAGVLDRSELGGWVARQVKQIVLSLFEIDDGVSIFEERRRPIPLEFMVSLSVHRLLYEGVRRMKSAKLVRSGLGDLEANVVLAASPPFRFGTRKCSAEELDILDQAIRPVSVRRLACGPGGLDQSRLQSVYAFVAAGVLETGGGEDARRQPVIPLETGTFLLKALRNRPDPSFREAIEVEVAQELARSDRFDGENWLNLSKSAGQFELVRALEDKMEYYHQLLEAAGDDAELRSDIEMILGRASAMQRLARRAAAAETTAVLAPITAELPFLERAPATEALPVDHLLLEGQARTLVNDFVNAAKVYEKLVDHAPDVPGYRVRLAVALSRHPNTAKKAEREFLEAVRLDPDNAEFRYQLGLYYKRMRRRSGALAELRTAVRLDPKHRGAHQEIEALAPRHSVLGNSRRMFK